MTPGQYRLALDPIAQALMRAALAILRPAFRPGAGEGAKRAAAAELTFEIRRSRADVARVTVEFMRGQARVQGGRDPRIPAPRGYPVEAARAVIDDALERGVGRAWHRALEEAAFAAVRHAEQAGRDMIFDAAELYDDDAAADLNIDLDAELDDEDDEDDYGLDDADDVHEADREVPTVDDVDPGGRVTQLRPVAWARVLTGADNCAFCVMLASRGAVYKARSTALYGGGQSKYHDRCDCIAMPVYSAARWAASDAGRLADDLYRKLWLPATKGYSGMDALNALARELYRMKKAGREVAPDIRKAA
ncbi:hypothetical protein ACFWGP_05400 [Agromyces sp. NPDC127015]|uniref:VG15 protein n=1 Tax=Agromyces sp. NPDC127015 TaxID=3347108 RepID=UPI003656FBFC